MTLPSSGRPAAEKKMVPIWVTLPAAFGGGLLVFGTRFLAWSAYHRVPADAWYAPVVKAPVAHMILALAGVVVLALWMTARWRRLAHSLGALALGGAIGLLGVELLEYSTGCGLLCWAVLLLVFPVAKLLRKNLPGRADRHTES